MRRSCLGDILKEEPTGVLDSLDVACDRKGGVDGPFPSRNQKEDRKEVLSMKSGKTEMKYIWWEDQFQF